MLLDTRIGKKLDIERVPKISRETLDELMNVERLSYADIGRRTGLGVKTIRSMVKKYGLKRNDTKILSEAHIQAISIKRNPNLPKRTAKKERAVSQLCKDTGEVIASFGSMTEAAHSAGVSHAVVSSHCRGVVKKSLWKYKT